MAQRIARLITDQEVRGSNPFEGTSETVIVPMTLTHSRMAQLAEQSAVNRQVVGSSPTAGAIGTKCSDHAATERQPVGKVARPPDAGSRPATGSPPRSVTARGGLLPSHPRHADPVGPTHSHPCRGGCFGPVAQMDSAPPCGGGGRRFESCRGRCERRQHGAPPDCGSGASGFESRRSPHFPARRGRERRGVEKLVSRRAHNPEVAGSNPAPATTGDLAGPASRHNHPRGGAERCRRW